MGWRIINSLVEQENKDNFPTAAATVPGVPGIISCIEKDLGLCHNSSSKNKKTEGNILLFIPTQEKVQGAYVMKNDSGVRDQPRVGGQRRAQTLLFGSSICVPNFLFLGPDLPI